MKKLTLFYLETCPYCINAKKALKELGEEKAAYAAAEIEWIEESRQPSLAESYDYYYVPTVFLDGEKLYEAHPGESFEACKDELRRCLDRVL